MGRVNWAEAKEYYMSGTHVSYSMVAQKYGVSKSTAQSYGTRHGWKSVREAIFNRKVEILIEEKAQEVAEIEKDHLNKANYIQATALRNMNHFVAQMQSGKYEDHYSREVLSSIRALKIGMDLEAAILGLTRHKIYQIVEVDQNYKSDTGPTRAEQASLNIDEIIKMKEKSLAYFKRRKAMIEQSQAGRA